MIASTYRVCIPSEYIQLNVSMLSSCLSVSFNLLRLDRGIRLCMLSRVLHNVVFSVLSLVSFIVNGSEQKYVFPHCSTVIIAFLYGLRAWAAQQLWCFVQHSGSQTFQPATSETPQAARLFARIPPPLNFFFAKFILILSSPFPHSVSSSSQRLCCAPSPR